MQVFADFEMVKFQNVKTQIILFPQLQSGIRREASFVWILAEEITIHWHSHPTWVESESNFENLLEFKWKAAVSFCTGFSESENMIWIKFCKESKSFAHSIELLVELLRKTFFNENLTSIWKACASVFPTKNFSEKDPLGLPPALALNTITFPSLNEDGTSFENAKFGSRRVW